MPTSAPPPQLPPPQQRAFRVLLASEFVSLVGDRLAMVGPPTGLTLDTARRYLVEMGEAVIGTEARRRSPG